MASAVSAASWFAVTLIAMGKRRAQLLLLGMAALGGVASWRHYTPASPWLRRLLPVFLASGSVGTWMFGESMVADVAAAEARSTGERTEASFSAVFGWALRISIAVSVLVSSLMLNAAGLAMDSGASDEGQKPT